jgi:hypothetical protein
MRFEVLTAVKMSLFFWVVRPCGLIGRYDRFGETFCWHSTAKVRISGNSSIGKVALAAYFCRYPASRGISRAVPKVSMSSTGGAARTDQLTRRPRLVFIIAHIKFEYYRSPFSVTARSIYRHTPFPKRAG